MNRVGNPVLISVPELLLVGPEPALGYEIENELENWLLGIIRRGAPIPIDGLRYTVQRLCDVKQLKTPFVNNCPGKKWVNGFLNRHPRLSVKKAEYLSKQRSLLTENAVRKWFADVRATLLEEGVDLNILNEPDRIFNLDEAAIYTNPGGEMVIAEKGKTASKVGTDTKENVTILFTAAATGNIVTKLILLPFKRIRREIRDEIPNDWSIGKSDSGWMTAEAFFEYMANCFKEYLDENNIKRPVVVFLDGHSSHLSLPLSEFCAENGIIIICLPPNATHFIQPLDVGFYGPFKKKWKKFVKLYSVMNKGKDISKISIPKHINQLGLDFFGTDIKNAFKCCGLYPFDENNLKYDKLTTHDHSQTTNSSSSNKNDESELEISTNTATSQSMVSNESGESYQKKNLEFLESQIDSNILEDFQLTRLLNTAWVGDEKFSALYQIWNNLKNMISPDDCDIIILNSTPEVLPKDDTIFEILPSPNDCELIISDEMSQIETLQKQDVVLEVEVLPEQQTNAVTEVDVSPKQQTDTVPVIEVLSKPQTISEILNSIVLHPKKKIATNPKRKTDKTPPS